MAQGLPASFKPIEDDQKGLPDSFQPIEEPAPARPQMNFAIVNKQEVPVPQEAGFLDNYPLIRRLFFGPNAADLKGTPAEGMDIQGPGAMKIPGIESIFGAAANLIPGSGLASKIGRGAVGILGDTVASGFDPRTVGVRGSAYGAAYPPDFVAPEISPIDEAISKTTNKDPYALEPEISRRNFLRKVAGNVTKAREAFIAKLGPERWKIVDAELERRGVRNIKDVDEYVKAVDQVYADISAKYPQFAKLDQILETGDYYMGPATQGKAWRNTDNPSIFDITPDDKPSIISKINEFRKSKAEEELLSTFEPLPVKENESIIDYIKRNGIENINTTPEQALANRGKSKAEEELLAALGPEEKPTESLKNGLPIKKGAVTQDHINSLFKSIEDNPNLTPDEKFSAKAELTKVLTGTANEQAKILPKAIGKDLTETLEKSPKTQRLGERLASINGTSKAIMASTDLSAPLRQGLPLIHRKEYWKSFFDMPKMLKNEDFFNGLMQSIREDPMFKAADKAGLHITDIHAHSLAKREEAFMTTFAEKIPGVAASERAYTGFLNKLRFDTYKSMIANAQKAGLDVEKLAPEIAHYINVSTGRGSLGMFENSAVLLNQGLFSPRMISSRLTMLNPAYYYKLPKPVRMEALKSLFAVAAVSGTVTGLAKAAGAEISTDPFSADFGKIKVGNTRLDPYAGFQQYIVAADRLARYAYNRSVDTPSELKNFYGPYKRPNAVEVLGNFARSKESPLVSFAHDMATGKDYAGRPVHLAPMDWNDRGEIADRYIPLLIQDVMDLAKDDPKLLPLAIPAGFGMGLQTYESKKSAPAR